MYAGNMQYVKWIVDGLCASAAAFVAFLVYFVGILGYSVLSGDMDLDMSADSVVEALTEPGFWLQGMIFWGPAALLGFGAARLIGRKRPSLRVTASVAASSSFLFGLMISGSMALLVVCLS